MTYVILLISIVCACARAMGGLLVVSSFWGVGGDGWRAMDGTAYDALLARATHPALEFK